MLIITIKRTHQTKPIGIQCMSFLLPQTPFTWPLSGIIRVFVITVRLVLEHDVACCAFEHLTILQRSVGHISKR
jgi:hypothetical protein